MDFNDFEGYHVWGYQDASQCTDGTLHCVDLILQHANGGSLYCVSDDEGEEAYVGGEAEILRNTDAEKIQRLVPIIYRAGTILAVMGEQYAERLAELIADNPIAQKYVGTFTNIQQGFRVRLMTFMEYKGMCLFIGEMLGMIFDKEFVAQKGACVTKQAQRALILRSDTHCDATFLFRTWMYHLMALCATNNEEAESVLLVVSSYFGIPKDLLISLISQRITLVKNL